MARAPHAIEHVVARAADAAAQRRRASRSRHCARARQARARRRRRHARRRHRVLAVLVGLDRPAQGHRAHARQPVLDRRAVRARRARADAAGRRRVLGREAVLRLRPRQRADVSAVRRRDVGADGRAADAAGGVRSGSSSAAPTRVLRRADAVRGDARRRPTCRRATRVALRVCVSAGEALPREIGERFAAHFGCDILDGIGSTEMLHIFLSNRRGAVRYGTHRHAGAGLRHRAARRGRRAGRRRRDRRPVRARAERGAVLLGRPRAQSRATFEGAWTKSGDKYVARAPTATTRTRAAPTTC